MHNCSVTPKHHIICWGLNDKGQSNTPKNNTIIDHISIGAKHSCVVSQQNLVECWGDNEFGQINLI